MNRVERKCFLRTRILLFTHSMHKHKWQLSAHALTQWFVASIAQIVHDTNQYFGSEDWTFLLLFIIFVFTIQEKYSNAGFHFIPLGQRESVRICYLHCISTLSVYDRQSSSIHSSVFVFVIGAFAERELWCFFSALDNLIIDKSMRQWFLADKISTWNRSCEIAVFSTKNNKF